jgi:molybdopterin-containing oxidoreductase family iron-sulfur binding subunit
MRYAMAIDLERCIGCRTCMAVCKVHNAQPPGIWWNRVWTEGSETHEVAIPVQGSYQMNFLPLSCQMCDNAPCEKVCPTGATFISGDGRVLIDFERCIGCRYCMAACPYGVRQFNWEDPENLKPKDALMDFDYGCPDDVTIDSRLVYTPRRPRGVVEKCTFCPQYTEVGELPACVQGCPGNARIFGDLDDPQSAVSSYLSGRESFRLREDLGTSCKVFYLAAANKSKPLELPTGSLEQESMTKGATS